MANGILMIIIILMFLYLSLVLASPQHELNSSDGKQWTSPLSHNENYPNSSWITYTRNIDNQGLNNQPIKVNLENFSGSDITFAWKSTKRGFFGQFKLFIKDVEQTRYDNHSLGWDEVRGYNVDGPEDFYWSLYFPSSGQVWIAFPKQNISTTSPPILIPTPPILIPTPPILIPTPSAPEGIAFGYVGKNYNYSIDTISSVGRLNYTFKWGDGRQNGFSSPLPSGVSASLGHKWDRPGEYRVQVKATSDINDSQSSSWSIPLNVTIYEIEPINSSDNIQEKIDRADEFTELSFVDSVYLIDRGLIIKKKNLILNSSGKLVTIRGRNIIDSLMKLDQSDHVIVENLNFNKLKNGIEINNSNSCIIKDDIIKFSGCGYGIKISSGKNNIIETNLLELNSPSYLNDDIPIGIVVEGGNNIDIINNKININGSGESLLGYYIQEIDRPRYVTIRIPRYVNGIGVQYGNCEGIWSSDEDIVGISDCRVPDENIDPNVWCII